jgi:hypothetical protein
LRIGIQRVGEIGWLCELNSPLLDTSELAMQRFDTIENFNKLLTEER